MKRGTPDHPKMLSLARILGISQAHAVGIMEMLWHWSARFSPAGDIGKWRDENIAQAVGWEGDVEQFISALVSSGWLDRHEGVRLVVHDWSDHCEQAVSKHMKRHKLSFVQTCKDKVQTCPDISSLPLPLPLPAPSSSSFGKSSSDSVVRSAPTRARNEKRAEENGTNNENKNDDDDDRNTDPLKSLASLIEKATGVTPDRKLLRQIGDQVSKGNGTLREFVNDTRPRISRLKERPGPGFFFDLARQFHGTAATESPPEAGRKKPTCGRVGCEDGRLAGGGYCECKAGALWRQFDEMEKRPATGA